MQQWMWLGITLEGWLTLLAILIGPITALALQRRLDDRRAKRDRQLRVFHELMATRTAKLSARHVEALNSIDLEFAKGRDKQVSDAWRLYLDHLNVSHIEGPGWLDRANELLTNLLFEMSTFLGFGFDKVAIKRAVYSPRKHGEIEQEQEEGRKLLLDVLRGNRAMWMGVFTGDRPLAVQDAPTPVTSTPQNYTVGAPAAAESGQGQPGHPQDLP